MRRTLTSTLILTLIASLALLGACERPEPPVETFTLTVSVDGAGAGGVVSAPAGIDVSSGDAPASATFDAGTTVTLTAVPGSGSVFDGWTGGCSGADPCTITLASDVDVVATFTVAPPTLGQADLSAAMADFDGDLEQVGSSLMANDAWLAMEAFVASLGGFTGVMPLPPEDPFPPEFSLMEVVPRELPRGVFEYDPQTGVWELLAPATVLEYRLSFEDAEGIDRAAVLVIDWGTTTTVEDAGVVVEVPADDMSVELSVDGVPAAAFDLGFAWFSGPDCPAGILEPTSVAIDGSMGTDATLSLDGVVFSLSASALATSGEIAAAAGGDAVGVVWDVSLDVTVDRDPTCLIEDFAVDGGSLDVTLYSDSAGTRSSLGLDASFGNIQIDPDLGLVAVDLDGSLNIDGRPAVSFTGTLDDADGDGIPGDNLVLTFADGETMTFEAFLEAQFHATASAVARAWSALK